MFGILLLLYNFKMFIHTLVSHNDVKKLKIMYDDMCSCGNSGNLDIKIFLRRLDFYDCILITELTKPFDKQFLWNDFFQFVVFFSLAPMPAIGYGILIFFI